MDSDDRLSRERYDMEREMARSESQKGDHQHGLPSIPPLGSTNSNSNNSSRSLMPGGGGGSLIRMGETIGGDGSTRSSDHRGHASLPKPLGLPPHRKRNRSSSPPSNSSSHSNRHSKGSRVDSYVPSNSSSNLNNGGGSSSNNRSRDYDYDYGYDSRTNNPSSRSSRPEEFDSYHGSSGNRGYSEDYRRGGGSTSGKGHHHDDFDPYYDHRQRGYDDYAEGGYGYGGYDYDFRDDRRGYGYEDGYGYDSYGYAGYDDWNGGRGGRDPREADCWLGSGADVDANSHSSARANKEAGGVFDPFKHPGLLNFKSFASLAKSAGHSSIDAKDKLFSEYTTYRLGFQKRLLRKYFEENHEKIWFKEKYSTQVIDGVDYASERKERIKKGRFGRKNVWLQELRAGEIDGVCWDLKVASKEAIEEDASNPVDPGNRGFPVGFDVPASTFTRGGRERIQHENAIIPPDPALLFILSLPPDQPRKGLERILEKEEGFQYLALAEPNAAKHNMRVGWARFDDGIDTEALSNKLNPIAVNNSGLPHLGNSTIPIGVVSKRATSRLRIITEFSTSLKRMRFDLFQARRLISLFENQDKELFGQDSSHKDVLDISCSEEIRKRVKEMNDGFWKELLEKEEIRENLVEEKWKNSDDKDMVIVRDSDEAGNVKDLDDEGLKNRKELVRTLLDLSIDCLRQVYNLDYYSCVKCEYPEELVRRATLSVRRCLDNGKQIELNRESKDGSQEDFHIKTHDDRASLLFFDSSDSEIDLVPHGGVNIQDWILEEARNWVQEAGPEKFRCTVEVPAPPPDEETLTQQCGKLFKGSMFVQKHVANKHRAFLDEKISSKLEKEKLFNQYVKDPARPMRQYQLNKDVEAARDRDRAPNGTSRSRLPPGKGGALGNFSLGNGPIRLEDLAGRNLSRSSSSSTIHSSKPSNGFLIRMGNSRPSTDKDYLDESLGPRAASNRDGFIMNHNSNSGNGNGSNFSRSMDASSSPLSSRLGPKPIGNDMGIGMGMSLKGISNGNGNGFKNDNNDNNSKPRNQGQGQNTNGFSSNNPQSNPNPTPLPTNPPQPVDPRASKQQSYHDLDGPANGSDDVELNY